jgi:hypothetical protein
MSLPVGLASPKISAVETKQNIVPVLKELEQKNYIKKAPKAPLSPKAENILQNSPKSPKKSTSIKALLISPRKGSKENNNAEESLCTENKNFELVKNFNPVIQEVQRTFEKINVSPAHEETVFLNPLHPDYHLLVRRASQEENDAQKNLNVEVIDCQQIHRSECAASSPKKIFSTQEFYNQCHERLLQYAFDEKLQPLGPCDKWKKVWSNHIKPHTDNVKADPSLSQIKQTIKHVHTCQKFMTTGLDWKAADKSTLRSNHISQALRGLRLYDKITINNQEIFSWEQITNGNETYFDDTRPCNWDDKGAIPDDVRRFYLNLFTEIGQYIPENNAFCSLKNLLNHTVEKKDRFFHKLMLASNMDMWALCDKHLRAIFPKIFNPPYKTLHHRITYRIPDFGEPDASMCHIWIEKNNCWVEQRKKIVVVKLLPDEEPDKRLIAHFTVICRTPLPKKGACFEANIRAEKFYFNPGATNEDREAFTKAFTTGNLDFQPA